MGINVLSKPSTGNMKMGCSVNEMSVCAVRQVSKGVSEVGDDGLSKILHEL